MQQRRHQRVDGRLLAAVKGAGGDEDPGGLPLEFAGQPERSQLVDLVLQLSRDISKSRRRAEGDRGGFLEVLRLDERHLLLQIAAGRHVGP